MNSASDQRACGSLTQKSDVAARFCRCATGAIVRDPCRVSVVSQARPPDRRRRPRGSPPCVTVTGGHHAPASEADTTRPPHRRLKTRMLQCRSRRKRHQLACTLYVCRLNGPMRDVQITALGREMRQRREMMRDTANVSLTFVRLTTSCLLDRKILQPFEAYRAACLT